MSRSRLAADLAVPKTAVAGRVAFLLSIGALTAALAK